MQIENSVQYFEKVYLFARKGDRDGEGAEGGKGGERDREHFYICWFTPQMHAIREEGVNEAKIQELNPDCLPCA